MTPSEANESISELRQIAKQAEAERLENVPDTPLAAHPMRKYRALLFQVYVVVAAVSFAVLLLLARHVAYFSFDLKIARAVQALHTHWLDAIMESVSNLGFSPVAGWLVGLIILFLYLIGRRWAAVMLLFAALGARGLELMMKIIVQRQRPSSELVTVFGTVTGYSFPSGHVLLFTAFLGFLMFVIYTVMPRSWLRAVGLSFLGGLIALVGVSRVYLGQHWPSDAIGGYLLGSLWLALTIYIYRKGRPRFFSTPASEPAVRPGLKKT